MPTNTLRPDPSFNVEAVSLDAEEGEGRPSSPDRAGGQWVAAGIALLFLLAAGAGYFLWPRAAIPPPVASAPPTVSPEPQSMPEPVIKHPIEQVPIASTAESAALPPLPALDDSDQVARDVIETTLNGDTYLRLLAPTAIVRHIVATIDNLPRKTIATRILPVKIVPGAFATTTGGSGAPTIAPDNAGRYAAYVNAAESIDTTRLAQFYVRLYPLFQQAYVDLGYPNGYFNDRVIDVIDHLLAAPELDAPAALAQPKVLFEFADPALESLSAGQKILVRTGTPNERRLKAKLREVRKALSVSGAKPRTEMAAPEPTAVPQARDTSAPSASAPPHSPAAR